MPQPVARRVESQPAVMVPRLWPGGAVVCLGSGPSLTQADVDYVRGKVSGVIAVNDAFRLAPWADVLYACDAKWWYWHWMKGAQAFAGLKFSLDAGARRHPGVQILEKTGETGLELEPIGLRAGRNSGYQAINLAVHLGGARVILLGYDMRGEHFFGQHPDKSRPPFAICVKRFDTIIDPLKRAGVEVINCSAKTALTAFPCRPLREVLLPTLVAAIDLEAHEGAPAREKEVLG